MKNSSQFISESVFRVNIKYARLQNETKELFFKCLEESRELAYFKAKLEKLWAGVDRKYYQEELNEYEALIHEINMMGKEHIEIVPDYEGTTLFALIPLSVSMKQENRFIKIKEKEYNNSINSKAYEVNKEEYLKMKVQRYNNQVVPYYSKTDGKLLRYVQLSTYESMIHNTNLTRAGWNTTLNDGDRVGIRKYYIPYHSFSCPHCIDHQNKIMTKEEVIDLVGDVEEQEGDILHPNCKCTLTFYDSYSKFNKPKYSDEELEEQYNIRQKVNTLTLKKEEVATDMRIQKMLGNQDEVDKLNQQRNKINKEIRELKEALPTESLRKQVVAINR